MEWTSENDLIFFFVKYTIVATCFKTPINQVFIYCYLVMNGVRTTKRQIIACVSQFPEDNENI